MTAVARPTEAWWGAQTTPVELCAAVARLHRDGAAPRPFLLRAVAAALRVASAGDVAGAWSARRVLRAFVAPGRPDTAALLRAADEAQAEIKAFWLPDDHDPPDGEPPHAADAALCLARAAQEPSDEGAAKLAAYAALACTFGRGPEDVAALADAVRAELPWSAVRPLLPPDAAHAPPSAGGHIPSE